MEAKKHLGSGFKSTFVAIWGVWTIQIKIRKLAFPGVEAGMGFFCTTMESSS